jgi:hydrogenase expression/formation protein HypC
MCLGIPGEIVTIRPSTLRMGDVVFGSVRREVCLEYVPEAQVGDYVVVHAGFAIAKLDLDQAKETAVLIASALLLDTAAQTPANPSGSDGATPIDTDQVATEAT